MDFFSVRAEFGGIDFGGGDHCGELFTGVSAIDAAVGWDFVVVASGGDDDVVFGGEDIASGVVADPSKFVGVELEPGVAFGGLEVGDVEIAVDVSGGDSAQAEDSDHDLGHVLADAGFLFEGFVDCGIVGCDVGLIFDHIVDSVTDGFDLFADGEGGVEFDGIVKLVEEFGLGDWAIEGEEIHNRAETLFVRDRFFDGF